MAHLIDKDAILAEIKELSSAIKINLDYKKGDAFWIAQKLLLERLKGKIDTLEVKEVDEVKIGETKIYLEDDGGEPPYDSNQWLDLSCTEYAIPKALFKDGDNVEILIRKAQKGE